MHAGRPFGGCSILYRKCLSLAISRLPTSSNLFCAITVRTSDGKSYLMFCVYMPYDRHPSSFTDYFNTLGEIHGLIDANPNSGIFLIGDFNVDFDHPGPLKSLLSNFLLEMDMSSVDLGSSITYTYERDDGISRSWIDHIICSQSCSSLVSDISVSHCGSYLSDHSSLMFTLCTTVEPFTTPASPSSCPSKSAFGINWSKVSSTDIDRYCVMVSKHLPSFARDILNCSIHDCSVHHKVLDPYTHSLISVLDSCSRLCFPSYTHISASLDYLAGMMALANFGRSQFFGIGFGLGLAALQLVYFST